MTPTVTSLRERKRGKVGTVLRGLANDAALSELLKTLKNACGAGRNMTADGLEIQGDHASRIAELLRDKGYRVKG